MPKRVDPAAQRSAIAQAAIRVIDASGLEAARLRDVAAAASVTTGAVTHYFDGKDAVLEAALEEIVDSLLDRVSETNPRSSDPEALFDLVCATLPTDGESQREWRVWLAFWGRAVADDRLRRLHQRYYAEIIDRLAPAADPVRRAHADAIVAAIDGVALRAVLEPEDWPPERQRATLGLLLRPLLQRGR